jgi:hypothetical protein
MSLINQMLRDLEARHATGSEKLSLPNEVRPLPAEATSQHWLKWIIAIAALVLLLALAWWGWDQAVVPVPTSNPVPITVVVPEPALPLGPDLKLDPDLAPMQPPEPLHELEPTVQAAAPKTSLPRPVAVVTEPKIPVTADRVIEPVDPGTESKPPIVKRPPGSNATMTPLQQAREQLAAGQRDAAEATLKQGLETSPRSVALRQMLFGLLVASGATTKRWRHCRRVWRCTPNRRSGR